VRAPPRCPGALSSLAPYIAPWCRCSPTERSANLPLAPSAPPRRTHPCNLFEFSLYGGLSPQKRYMEPILHGGLRNDQHKELFSLRTETGRKGREVVSTGCRRRCMLDRGLTRPSNAAVSRQVPSNRSALGPYAKLQRFDLAHLARRRRFRRARSAGAERLRSCELAHFSARFSTAFAHS